MKKSLFAGWHDVFSFTFARQTENKYKKVTTLLAILFFIGAAAISTIMAFVQKKEDEVVEIEKVYLYDESGLDTIYLDGFLENYKTQFPRLEITTSEKGMEEVAKDLAGTDSKDVILHLEKTEDGYKMTVILPDGGAIGKGDAEKLNDALGMMMEQSKLLSSQIPMEKLVYAMSGVDANLHIAGEDDKSVGEQMMQIFVPMLVVVMMFFLCFVYGTSVGNVVSIEKTSKLMEMILTHIRPNALIVGKVLAVTLSGVLQYFIWLASFVGGFFAGHVVAKEVIYPEYNNVIIEVIKILQQTDGSSAFSIGSVLLGIPCMLIGFFFFCMVAALVSCFATKAEELGQVMGFYMIIEMASFYAAYMIPSMLENDTMNLILRCIPFTSAFLTPGDVLVGNIGLLEGALETALLLACTIIVSIIAGKIYKSLVLNKGKNLFKAMFAKKGKKATQEA